jgi:DNA-directed RNA polymerase subunit beta'
MSTNNILSPANGKPIIVPSQDIVLGLYYMTMEGKNEPGAGMAFTNIGEIQQALDAKAVTMHTPIKARYRTNGPDGKAATKLIQRRRRMLSETPRHPNMRSNG